MAENFQNFYVTKLREACDATATTIYVDTVPAITEGTLVLEYANSTKHEIIHFTGVSGYGLTGCTRGLEGTTAQSHSAGTDVRQNLTAGMIDKIINGVITTENIADSAVTTAKINDGAVTSDKIDFTTLAKNTYEANNFAVTTTAKDIYSYTIPTSGQYLIIVNCSLHSVAAQHSTYINTIINGNTVDTTYCGIHADYWGSLVYTNIKSLTAGDVVKINLRDTYGIVASSNTKIRINFIQLSRE